MKKIFLLLFCWFELNGEPINGATWTQVTPAASPTPLSAPAMSAYETNGKDLILFGGYIDDDTVISNKTYSYSLASNTWTDITATSNSPSARFGASMGILKSNEALMFGGINSLARFGCPDLYYLFTNTD